MTKTWDAITYQARHSYVFAHGENLVEFLEPKPGERILDLGCGSGQLTAKIAERGAEASGIDQSAEMIVEARRNFPGLGFEVGDAASFTVPQSFDAVFSNAALHWVKDAEGVAKSVARALLPGGRFVFEMGGKGNVQAIIEAIQEIAGPINTPWFFPSVGEYAAILERHGFEVSFAALFDRPTHVEGEDGLEDWLKMYIGHLLTDELRRRVSARLRAKMFQDGVWTLDYRRLRVIAKRIG